MTGDVWILKGSGQVLENVHQEGQCFGFWCTIHRPMPGPWEKWPMRFIGNVVMARLCPHGFAHPAVEDVINFLAYPDHDCDGCECGGKGCVAEKSEQPLPPETGSNPRDGMLVQPELRRDVRGDGRIEAGLAEHVPAAAGDLPEVEEAGGAGAMRKGKIAVILAVDGLPWTEVVPFGNNVQWVTVNQEMLAKVMKVLKEEEEDK